LGSDVQLDIYGVLRRTLRTFDVNMFIFRHQGSFFLAIPFYYFGFKSRKLSPRKWKQRKKKC